jgi:hypothetical protein
MQGFFLAVKEMLPVLTQVYAKCSGFTTESVGFPTVTDIYKFVVK